jgi:hypothetical protein
MNEKYYWKLVVLLSLYTRWLIVATDYVDCDLLREDKLQSVPISAWVQNWLPQWWCKSWSIANSLSHRRNLPPHPRLITQLEREVTLAIYHISLCLGPTLAWLINLYYWILMFIAGRKQRLVCCAGCGKWFGSLAKRSQRVKKVLKCDHKNVMTLLRLDWIEHHHEIWDCRSK